MFPDRPLLVSSNCTTAPWLLRKAVGDFVGIAGYQGDWGDRGIIKGYFFFTLANFILEPSLVREMGRGD